MKLSLLMTAAGAACFLASAAVADTTGPAGSSAPFNNRQASLVMTQSFAGNGIFPCNGCGDVDAPFVVGQLHTFAGNFAPFGQLRAQGQLASIRDHTALFSVIETTYGGDGVNTFAAPNAAGRLIVGAGAGPGLSTYTNGQVTGAPTNVMTLDQLPTHTHGLPGGGATGPAGGLSPINNVQDSLVMRYQIAVTGAPSGVGINPFIGQIGMFGGNFEPGGWMEADGRMLSIADYSGLFNVIGTTYGGDGVNTFALPNLAGRTIVGAGGGLALGDTFGNENFFLTPGQMPSHDHDLPMGSTLGAGGGLAFDNAQPSLALNYLIAVEGIFPVRPAEGFDGVQPEDPFLGEVVAYAGGDIPDGWMLADGSVLNIAFNTALFSILGTAYGGDGRFTFALPDLRGRAVMGSGFGFEIGQVYGERFTTLTEAQLATHTHEFDDIGPPVAVPEPASWALMITGFGLGGMALRRRRVAAA